MRPPGLAGLAVPETAARGEPPGSAPLLPARGGGHLGVRRVERIVAAARLAAGLGHLWPHALRHTAATRLAVAGVAPAVAAAYLGMSEEVMVRYYLAARGLNAADILDGDAAPAGRWAHIA